jgi:hypothetical protein
MVRMFWRIAALICAAVLLPPAAAAQVAAVTGAQRAGVADRSRVLFRVFLNDGRVLNSYGEWTRIEDSVVFSMPTQLSRDPIELHLVTIPSRTVDWRRTDQYAESVRAAAYGATRGDADFSAFSGEVAKVLNDSAKIRDPKARLETAERARQKLADWPAQHYGYRNTEVRDALGVLDEVIAQMRASAGMTRFDLALSKNAPLPEPPPPPLPPPTDAELAEQFVAAASISETPAQRVSLLQTVMQLLDRAMGILPSEWAARMRSTVGGDLERERKTQEAYDELRTKTLAEASRLASKGRASDLEKLRAKVKAEDQRLGGQRAGEIAALLDTIDIEAASAIRYREAKREFDRYAPAFRKYRRSTNSAFKVFADATTALEQVKSMAGPPATSIEPLIKRLAKANKGFRKVVAPDVLADDHAVIASAWELADNAFRLRMEAVSSNNIDVAQRASSAAAGALMLYQRARAEQLSAMEPPTAK